jgi:hypothetical protein
MSIVMIILFKKMMAKKGTIKPEQLDQRMIRQVPDLEHTSIS